MKLQRLRRRANLNRDHSLKNPRTFHLSYLRADECSWKKIDQVSSAATDHCTSTAVSSARKARSSTRSFRFALFKYYPGQKNRYSREIHEVDRQSDHVISRDIDFDLQREFATRSYRESRRCRTEARYRTISHDRTVDQPHEFLGCNDFFGQGSISTIFTSRS